MFVIIKKLTRISKKSQLIVKHRFKIALFINKTQKLFNIYGFGFTIKAN